MVFITTFWHHLKTDRLSNTKIQFYNSGQDVTEMPCHIFRLITCILNRLVMAGVFYNYIPVDIFTFTALSWYAIMWTCTQQW